MTVFGDIAAIETRIAQITQSFAFAVAPAPALIRSKAEDFSAVVRHAESGIAKMRIILPAPGEIDRLISANARAWQVDPALVKAIMANESGFNPRATSRTGAQGLMQLEPGTAAGLGVSNAYDPAQNIRGGTQYIKGLLERFHGDMYMAVAAYNAGPGNVEKYGGVPPYAETQNYVVNVLDSYRRYKEQVR